MEEHVPGVTFVQAREHPLGRHPSLRSSRLIGVFDSFVDTNTIDVEALSRAARISARPTPCRRQRGATKSRSVKSRW